MKTLSVLAFLFSLAALGGVIYSVKHPATATSTQVAKEESVYDRVTRTGVIKCGYATYPPFFSKDPNTGVPTGIYVDLMEKITQSLDLKVEWSTEAQWATVTQDLATNRYDAFCADLFPNSSRGKIVDFSIPFVYSALNAYVRSDDTRYTGDMSNWNDPSVRFAVLDGSIEEILARTRFPLAQRIPLPEGSDYPQIVLTLTSGKADILLTEPSVVIAFDKNNPGQLKNITSGHPIKTIPNVIAFRNGQEKFKSMIDSALTELLNDGEIDSILGKYEPAPGVYYRVAYPYRAAP